MTTPYRDDTDSLQARHASLSEELSSVQAKTRELDELKASEARLAKEVADVAKKLEGRAARRALPLLESLQIASACTAKWDEMIGDERARFCTHCQKDVFNLSAMPRDEAESFMRARTSDVCVRLYKRFDGTVLTSDCPVGVKRKRRRKAVVAAVGGSLLAAGALVQMATRPTMGAVGSPLMGEPTASPVMGAMPYIPDTSDPAANDPPPVAQPTPRRPNDIAPRPLKTTEQVPEATVTRTPIKPASGGQ
jgi:hypothetical protein